MITFVMDNSETKLGFTRLQVINEEGKKAFLKYSISYNGKTYISSTAVRDDVISFENCIPHGPCVMIKVKNVEADCLICFRWKEWISTATPWKNRSRGLWPSPPLIREITQYGILFVPVGCKASKFEDIEWRISFSIAEKQLIHSFTHTQFLCYAIMKTILSDIIKKRCGELLCSYFIKTIMFWLAEEYEPSFWVKNEPN